MAEYGFYVPEEKIKEMQEAPVSILNKDVKLRFCIYPDSVPLIESEGNPEFTAGIDDDGKPYCEFSGNINVNESGYIRGLMAIMADQTDAKSDEIFVKIPENYTFSFPIIKRFIGIWRFIYSSDEIYRAVVAISARAGNATSTVMEAETKVHEYFAANAEEIQANHVLIESTKTKFLTADVFKTNPYVNAYMNSINIDCGSSYVAIASHLICSTIIDILAYKVGENALFTAELMDSNYINIKLGEMNPEEKLAVNISPLGETTIIVGDKSGASSNAVSHPNPVEGDAAIAVDPTIDNLDMDF